MAGYDNLFINNIDMFSDLELISVTVCDVSVWVSNLTNLYDIILDQQSLLLSEMSERTRYIFVCKIRTYFTLFIYQFICLAWYASLVYQTMHIIYYILIFDYFLFIFRVTLNTIVYTIYNFVFFFYLNNISIYLSIYMLSLENI